jgi:hypothetical protein
MRLFLLPFILCATSALADFIPAQEGLAQIHFDENSGTAAPQISVSSATSIGNCTGFFVSDDGYLLTGEHCFRKCSETSACQVLVNQKMVHARIVAISRCVPVTDENASRCKGLDYALLKFDPSEIPAHKCFRTSNQPLRDYQQIASIGYPMPTNRSALLKGARDSRGDRQYFSSGRITSDRKFTVLSTNADGSVKTETHSFQEIPADIVGKHPYWEMGFHESTIDLVSGSSGGPIFDPTSGVAVGIAKASVSTASEEIVGLSFVEPIAGVIDHIRTSFPNLNPLEVFSCRNAVGPR